MFSSAGVTQPLQSKSDDVIDHSAIHFLPATHQADRTGGSTKIRPSFDAFKEPKIVQSLLATLIFRHVTADLPAFDRFHYSDEGSHSFRFNYPDLPQVYSQLILSDGQKPPEIV